MPWSIHCIVNDPNTWGHTEMTLGSYESQNLARWWALAFIQKGSIIMHQGQPDETIVPIHWVSQLQIRED